MPRRKKLPLTPDYEGVSRNEGKLLVQKSNPLQTLSETEMTLPEFKILDVYLSRIDSHNPEKRYVRLEKGELERLLGVERIRSEELDKRLKNLFQTVKVIDPDKPKGFTIIGLFERAEAVPDDDGLWKVDLVCTPSAMEYVFNIENLGYLRYRLRNVINLTSRYSYVLYLYLEDNRFRKTWEIDLVDLKRILRCSATTYDNFKEFNRAILKRCQEELQEKTDLRFQYEPIRKGRKTSSIRFTVETQDVIPGQIELDDYPDPEPDREIPDIIDLLGEACCPLGSDQSEFNPDEIASLLELIVTLPDSVLPDDPNHGANINIRRYHYLAQKYKLMVAQSTRTQIKHRFSYLRKLIEQDTK